YRVVGNREEIRCPAIESKIDCRRGDGEPPLIIYRYRKHVSGQGVVALQASDCGAERLGRSIGKGHAELCRKAVEISGIATCSAVRENEQEAAAGRKSCQRLNFGRRISSSRR